jgi:hypothetical protein
MIFNHFAKKIQKGKMTENVKDIATLQGIGYYDYMNTYGGFAIWKCGISTMKIKKLRDAL